MLQGKGEGRFHSALGWLVLPGPRALHSPQVAPTPLPPLPLVPAKLLSMQSLAHAFHHTIICSSYFRPCQVPVSCLSLFWKTT